MGCNFEAMDKPILVFIWQGISGRYGVWRDGLWAAMKILERDYDVRYQEPKVPVLENAIVLYWEAPCTLNGKDAHNYKWVQALPNKKALLFAGGPIKKEWLDGFDHVFYESKINGEELKALGIPCSLAFGINENIFFSTDAEKEWDGIHHGTCAGWKRQKLVGESIGNRGIVVGRRQETDTYGFDRCKELGCTVVDELPPEQVSLLVNRSWSLIQSSDYWGGGQRATLEAMACNVPVVCMKDSPKNREYVEESGFGLVVDPEPVYIKSAVEEIKKWPLTNRGREYILSKWTAQHYANSLKLWLKSL